MSSPKVLITGSGGILGSYCRNIFSNYKLFLTTKNNLDVTKREDVLRTINEIKPDKVIHLAAKTDVDGCERDKDGAFLTNHHGTRNVVEACMQVGATLVYTSAAAVFSGRKNYYTEMDKPHPINTYGKTKLLGEQSIQNNLPRHFIIRAGWMMGGGLRQKKFIAYIINQINSGKKELLAVDDKFGTLTYAKELAAFIKKLVDSDKYGIYHFGSSGACSRFMIAERIIKLLGKKIKVTR